jgi:hypothetical protein
MADHKNSSPAFGEDRFLAELESYEKLYETCKAAAKRFEAGGNREDFREVLIAVREQLDGLPS